MSYDSGTTNQDSRATVRGNPNAMAVVRSAALVLLLGSVAVPPIAFAATPAKLIDHDLHPHRVNIQSVVDGVIQYWDADRSLRTESIDKFVQLRITAQAADAPTDSGDTASLGVITLTDGQRIVGRWVGASRNGQAVRWKHPLLGTREIELEHIAAIRFRARSPHDTHAVLPNAGPQSDTLTLTNGDTLTGFVTEATDTGLSIQSDTSPGPITVPLETTHSLTLANPRRPRDPAAPLLHLADSTRITAVSISIAKDRLAVVLPNVAGDTDPVAVALAHVRRIDWSAGGAFLVDLATLPMRVIGGGQVFGVAALPRIEQSDILLHAPVTVEFDLPPGAVRFAANALLDAPPGSHPAAAWADFSVIVRDDTGEVAKADLSATFTAARLNHPVAGRTLTIQLHESRNGPILDRLRLSDAAILIRPMP